MCNNKECNCIAEILAIIIILQGNACPENCLNSCDRPILGGGENCVICNTRPIMLYTACGNNVPITLPTSKNNTDCSQQGSNCSSVFRVEKVDGCCATFRVLAPNPDETSVYPYVSTDSFFTIDISCVCYIRCLNDTYVECL